MRWWQVRKQDSDLERELHSDLELEEEEQRERGLSAEEARYAARRAFGNTALIREQTHEAWGWATFEQLWQDLRYALRQMRRSPGYFAVCLITLCLGIGMNAAVFSVIQAVILRPLPYHDPNRLMQVTGSQLLHGRYFSEEDGPHSPLVAVIDESAARRYWPGENAVGKRFKGQDRRGENDDWLTVIGVVRDIRTHGLEREPTPHIYEWYRQSGNATPDLVVRVMGNSVEIASTIRRTIRSVAPAAILSNIATVDQQLSRQLTPRRFQTSLLGLFSLLALLLASVGIYGLMHYSVSLRTREIGIRMALGAQRGSVYRLVTGQASWLTAAGLAIGLPCSMGTSMLMRRLLFGIQIWDMATLGGVTLLLAVASVAASFLPARRAASLDPMQALRIE